MKRIVLAVLLLLGSSSIPGCAAAPCSTDPGSLACNKYQASREVYRVTYIRCMYEWRKFEKEQGMGVTIIGRCGEAAPCCIGLARERAARILR